jgi:hypothetical protein
MPTTRWIERRQFHCAIAREGRGTPERQNAAEAQALEHERWGEGYAVAGSAADWLFSESMKSLLFCNSIVSLC